MGAGGTVVWLRQDLRLRDNPALHAAAARRQPVIPVYIRAPEEEVAWPPGAAQKWWLHQSLHSLQQQLAGCGSRLILARGPALEALLNIAKATRGTAVYWNERYEPAAVATQKRVEKGLQRAGLQTRHFNSALLAQPGGILNESGRPYRVYTAFQRALLEVVKPAAPLARPSTLAPPQTWPQSATLDSLGLLPPIKWYRTMSEVWTPGEAGAHEQLQVFLKNALRDYSQARNSPAVAGTSRLSPHLHFGEIGPGQIWHALGSRGRGSQFLAEIAWREFGYHLLHHFPQSTDKPLRAEFANFPWRRDRARLRAWQRGNTGVPLVDAGMRELWATGWMHNRVRMVVASFLVKNLLIPWQDGARWFWDTLVDADLASNTLNWQWVAGSGVDAMPFFRIFNPLTQAQRFDPEGKYIEKWVPELQQENDRSYPAPIVDLKESRASALAAFEALPTSRSGR